MQAQDPADELSGLQAEVASLRSELAGRQQQASGSPPPSVAAVPPPPPPPLPAPPPPGWFAPSGHGLSGPQLARYARHCALPSVGAPGQGRLAAASALVVGAGGLGSAALLYLAAAGVGRLTVADGDVVEESNLQRQVLHTEARLGLPKAASAAAALAALNSGCAVAVWPGGRVAPAYAAALVASHDVVLDCSDRRAPACGAHARRARAQALSHTRALLVCVLSFCSPADAARRRGTCCPTRAQPRVCRWSPARRWAARVR